jgi:hypothetical protein
VYGQYRVTRLLYPNKLGVFLLDRFCSLVVTAPGFRHRGPGFDSRRYQILCIAVGLERDLFILVMINEELLERKVAAPV